MNTASWICPRCARHLTKPLRARAARYHSTLPRTVSTRHLVYPPLLERARHMAVEHVALSTRLEKSYDARTAKKAGELASVVSALEAWDRANESLEELTTLLRDPATDSELRELANQDLEQCAERLTTASRSLTTALVPKHPFADLACLVEIRPGIGGKEAALFAAELLDMYRSYCSQAGLSAAVVSHERSLEDHLFIEAILEVSTPGAYGKLRSEAGVHRVQRVPETEVKGRVHTSTAAVMVLPSFPDTGSASDSDINDPSSDFYVSPADIRKEYMRASGAGGQHVNKTESAVRLTHIPTKISVHIQDRRNRSENENRAWQLMRSRIAQVRREAREDDMIKLRRNVIGVNQVGRSDKIRTYNFPQQRATDHRSGTTVLGIDGVMSGGANLEKLMESVRKWMTEMDVENMIASAQS